MAKNNAPGNPARTAPRNTAPAASGRVKFGDYRFVRVEFDATEKDDFRAALGDNRVEGLDLDHLLREGYSLKCSASDDGKTILVTLTQHHLDHQNAGLILTARHRDATTALLALAYKVHHIIRGDPWTQVEHERGGIYEDGLG